MQWLGGIVGGNVFVDFLADCPELTLLELADLDATLAFGGANECGVNQLQDGACAQGMRDDPRRRAGTAPNQSKGEEQTMRRMIGMDIHRTEGFGRSLGKEDEVVIEAAGNAMAVVHVPSPYVARVLAANPLQVKAIACAGTDKIAAGVPASLRAANFLPEVWLPDSDTERRRRLVARRNQVVRHRTRIKNQVHAILHAHPTRRARMPTCSHGWAGSGWRNSSCPMTRAPPSSGTGANSIG